MTQMITKVLPFEVKEVDRRVLEFVGSTEDKDRQGDVIMANGWQLKQYKKNPVFLWSHQYNEPPIGKAINVWAEDGKLKFHIKFAEKDEYEFADTIYRLYKGGYLRASSVGFLPLKSEPIEEAKDDEVIFGQPTRYLKQELLELSGCPVPANPNALAEAKAKGLIKDELPFLPALVVDKDEDEDVSKPYPNEHSCRLKDPGKYDRFARKNCEQKHDGKCIDVIYGIKEEKTEIQALRYKKDIWTESAAKSHCASRDGTFEAAGGEESEKETYKCECIDCGYKIESDKHCNELKCPKCGGKMRREERPGPGQDLYHSDNLEEDPEKSDFKKGFTQMMMADEIDYLGLAIESVGLNEDSVNKAWELVRTIFECVEAREPGSDIPVDIAEKVGAVLNKVNRERLEKIQTLAQEVLDSAEKPKPEEEPEKALSKEDIAKEVGDAVKSAIQKAQGKVQWR